MKILLRLSIFATIRIKFAEYKVEESLVKIMLSLL